SLLPIQALLCDLCVLCVSHSYSSCGGRGPRRLPPGPPPPPNPPGPRPRGASPSAWSSEGFARFSPRIFCISRWRSLAMVLRSTWSCSSENRHLPSTYVATHIVMLESGSPLQI